VKRATPWRWRKMDGRPGLCEAVRLPAGDSSAPPVARVAIDPPWPMAAAAWLLEYRAWAAGHEVATPSPQAGRAWADQRLREEGWTLDGDEVGP
jgi:hypothetical protein